MNVGDLQYEIRPLGAEEYNLALCAWREGHKNQPSMWMIPWAVYKRTYGVQFELILRDPATLLLGAYAPDGECLAFLVATPGARVDVVHWIHVKHRDRRDAPLRRHGIATALVRAADLGERWIYTLRSRKLKSSRNTLDVAVAAGLHGKGLGTATYVPIQDWLR